MNVYVPPPLEPVSRRRLKWPISPSALGTLLPPLSRMLFSRDVEHAASFGLESSPSAAQTLLYQLWFVPWTANWILGNGSARKCCPRSKLRAACRFETSPSHIGNSERYGTP